MKTYKIIHKAGKVESEVILNEQGDIVDGRTFKYYGSYFRTVEGINNESERTRLHRNIPYCFSHEKEMIALANRKNLPAVRLVCERPEHILEIEYQDSVSLQQRLESVETAMVERRHLVIETIRCIQTFHTAGLFLIDTHHSNFLLLPTGQIIFCDFGNAYSPEEMPFQVPPLAAGNTKENIYFSDAHHKAISSDRAMDRVSASAPYSADKLASNGLGGADDYWVFAHHILKIKVKIRDANGNMLEQLPVVELFDPDLIKVLEDVKRGKYASGNEILQKLCGSATTDFEETPWLPPDSGPVETDDTLKFSLPGWNFNFLASACQLLQRAAAPVVTTIICIAFGLGIGGNYEWYRQLTTGGTEVPMTVVSKENSDAPLIASSQVVGFANAMKPLASVPFIEHETVNSPEQPKSVVAVAAKQLTPQEKTLIKVSEQLRKPASSLEHRKALRKLALLKTPEASKVLETHLAQAKSDAASEQFALASNGIRVLHLLAGIKSPATQKAFAAIGDVIQQTIQAGPSENSRQKLELLAALGNVRAHHELAVWLESGKGLKERELAAAYGHYAAASRKVADAAKAVTRLEFLAPDMVKAPSTSKEGFRLLLAIAERPRNRETQYAVGRIYAQGLYGQPQDRKLAREYLMRSARHGFAEASVALKHFKLRG